MILISDAVIFVMLVRTSGESTQQLKLKAKIDYEAQCRELFFHVFGLNLNPQLP
jgi:hypothetical protein